MNEWMNEWMWRGEIPTNTIPFHPSLTVPMPLILNWGLCYQTAWDRVLSRISIDAHSGLDPNRLCDHRHRHRRLYLLDFRRLACAQFFNILFASFFQFLRFFQRLANQQLPNGTWSSNIRIVCGVDPGAGAWPPEICRRGQSVFWPPKDITFFYWKLLLDNSASFTSPIMKDLCQKWR